MDATQATVRQAGPGDADRLARMRYEFRAAEDPPVEAAVAWCRRQGVDSVILWPTAASRGLCRRCGFDRSEGIYELVLDGDG